MKECAQNPRMSYFEAGRNLRDGCSLIPHLYTHRPGEMAGSNQLPNLYYFPILLPCDLIFQPGTHTGSPWEALLMTSHNCFYVTAVDGQQTDQ